MLPNSFATSDRSATTRQFHEIVWTTKVSRFADPLQVLFAVDFHKRPSIHFCFWTTPKSFELVL
jgi:hypothetical protein